MGDPLRISHRSMDTGDRYFPDAYGIGVGAEEPACSAGTPARGWLSVLFSGVGEGSEGSGGGLAGTWGAGSPCSTSGVSELVGPGDEVEIDAAGEIRMPV